MKQHRAKRASRDPGGPRSAQSVGAPDYEAAVQAARGGNLALAGALYAVCLERDPCHVEALHDLGALTAQRGASAEALRLFEAAIRLRPHYAEAHANLCLLLGNLGRTEEAVAAGRRAVDLKPDFANAHANLGNALEASGQLDAARRAYETAARLAPRFAAAHVKLADILSRQGDLAAALSHADTAIGLTPRLAEAYKTRGIIHADLGRAAAARDDFRRALELDPSSATHHVNLGSACIQAGDFDAAEPLLRRAVALDPSHPDAHGNLGTLLVKQGATRAAFDAYHKAVTLNPRYGQAYSNLAGLLREVGEVDAAISMAELAVTLMPGNSDAYVNLAGALRQAGRQTEAIAAYRQALAINPRLGDVRVEICYYRQQACDWADLAADQEAAMASSFRAGLPVAPFPILSFPSTAVDQRDAARLWAGQFRAKERMAVYAPRGPEARERRLRIGYLSADFYNHATAMLIVEVFERHDKTAFEVFGYSIGRDDDSVVRRRMLAAFDHFVDLRPLSHIEAARRIHADEIDILIDLKGYTEGARTEILAYRPAPIQVNYLGFPGTMGAPFIDYVVADAIVAPDGAEFDEAIVRLPGCYQPNDRRRQAAEPPTRAACGLPDGAFVFCSFNNNYKLTPALFDIWMRLLAATPGAVLWLLQANELVAGNLRREAEARGVAGARLVFAPRVGLSDHLARIGLADLFLDTLPVNAHTTASECLWMGLPLVTCRGGAFASRVAASLLAAVNLADLATDTLDDYEALALALARDPDRLGRIRRHLADTRLTAPLFDTARYIRHYEAALLGMEARRAAGRAPEPFDVEDR